MTMAKTTSSTFTVEVLGNQKVPCDLIHHALMQFLADSSIKVNEVSSRELGVAETLLSCAEHGSDPSFFGLQVDADRLDETILTQLKRSVTSSLNEGVLSQISWVLTHWGPDAALDILGELEMATNHAVSSFGKAMIREVSLWVMLEDNRPLSFIWSQATIDEYQKTQLATRNDDVDIDSLLTDVILDLVSQTGATICNRTVFERVQWLSQTIGPQAANGVLAELTLLT
ncbi:hypothetical protein MXF29_22095 [Pseudomonas sp. NC26]|uniref:hypothetical protein n=1 Tax=Pseudomonas sp. NC26 TaxID=3114535 RepID=UPI002DE71A01|nr:hypothetical protein [Pseudomonas sp. NC26]